MAEQKPIISIDHVSMRFNLAKEKHESLKEYFVALLHGGVRFDEFFALDDVSFDIMPGDFYGLIGLNGSGKSTLLKVISGVYKPSAGRVTVNGTIAPLIELGNLDVARDFSDVRNVVQLYRRLLEAPAALGQTFNVCSGQAWSLNDVLAMVREISGHDFEVRVNPAFVRQNEVKTLVGSRAKLDAVVGEVPEIALRDTLRWMLEA